MIRLRFCALDSIHHAVYNKLECKLPDALHCTLPSTPLKYTPDCTGLHIPSLLDLQSHVSSQDTPKYTPSTLPSTLRSTPPSTFSSTLPSVLSRTLPIALDGALPRKLSRHSQAYSRARSQINSHFHSMVRSEEGRHPQSHLAIYSHVSSCMLDRETC